MTNREKVIKGLEICSEYGSWHGLDCEHNEAFKDCPYRGCETGCIVTIAKDAIALLKEQEEIVRCKDCRHSGFCNTEDIHRCTNPDGWFCADGKRR